MKRSILRILLIGLLTFGAFYLPSAAIVEVSAQADDLTVVNKTGFDIHALYMTLANAKEWGADILGVDTLARNNQVTIVFTKKEKLKLWDLRVEDATGAFIEWTGLNLRDVSSVTLYYKNGKATAIFNEELQSTVDIRGTWLGYYEDGSISPYVWNIDLTSASTIMIQDADGGKAKSRGSINGRNIVAQDFATKNGKVSADGNRIAWTDGVVWVRSNDLIDLTGTWIGYYDDGTKSEYVWSIIQRGTNITIQDANGGKTKSRGTFKGSKVVAQDFATQNGKLSADGMRITWTDGVVWVKQ
jgi:hypothetical protein